ncbi:Ribonuclease M5 [bioreactor metagenome]|uniref:Ribonuclease M5 n=1 Tax=bioreactor metagenome TaxID=1076179 RepID=A0A644YRX3_9ZZZZ
MLRIKEAIVVEGRYDKNTLSQIVDTVILETKGFGLFRDKELLLLLRRLAQRRGLIIFTDPDGAGFLIRNHLKGAIDPGLWKNAYIPDIHGKERRKRRPGAEGKLGVEGMRPEQLEEALRRAGATFEGEEEVAVKPGNAITKADLYSWGLSGRPDSAARRQDLMRRLELPEHLSASGLLEVLNALYSREELAEQIKQKNF